MTLKKKKETNVEFKPLAVISRHRKIGLDKTTNSSNNGVSKKIRYQF